METKDIKNRVAFSASASKVYEALMDSDIHSVFTQSGAEINPVVGGAFTTYDGYIEGTNVELVPGKRIVQKWRAIEDGWPDDYYSEVIFEFEGDSEESTILLFTHKNVPADMVESFEKGWIEHYWEPLESYLLEDDWDEEAWDDDIDENESEESTDINEKKEEPKG